MKRLKLTLALIFGLAIAPSIALAHQVETNYQLKSDTLEIQSVFSTGEAFESAQIIVYSPQNPDQPWLEAKTDQNGEFMFNPDPAIAGDWKVEIGEDSHWDRLIIPVTEGEIKIDEIAYLPDTHIHEHYDLANQFLFTLIAVGGIVGFKVLSRKF